MLFYMRYDIKASGEFPTVSLQGMFTRDDQI